MMLIRPVSFSEVEEGDAAALPGALAVGDDAGDGDPCLVSSLDSRTAGRRSVAHWQTIASHPPTRTKRLTPCVLVGVLRSRRAYAGRAYISSRSSWRSVAGCVSDAEVIGCVIGRLHSKGRSGFEVGGSRRRLDRDPDRPPPRHRDPQARSPGSLRPRGAAGLTESAGRARAGAHLRLVSSRPRRVPRLVGPAPTPDR